MAQSKKREEKTTQDVGIKDPPVLKTDTRETENLHKAISCDQKGASMYSLS
jgi:hypothetical protein